MVLRPAPVLEVMIRLPKDQQAGPKDAPPAVPPQLVGLNRAEPLPQRVQIQATPVAAPPSPPAPRAESTDDVLAAAPKSAASPELPDEEKATLPRTTGAATVERHELPRGAEQQSFSPTASSTAAPVQQLPGQPHVAPAVNAPVTEYRAGPAEPAGPKAGNQPAPGTHLDDQVPDEMKRQSPLRSVSIDFTPDGARDVRLRLAERGGDVHVTLHSTDPALTGRLSAGVHELAGSLANAGYDAQAWTNQQGRQGQRPYEEAQKPRRSSDADPDGEDFGGLLQQPGNKQ